MTGRLEIAVKGIRDDINGSKRPSAASGKAVERPSGGERTFRGGKVRTAGKYVLQRNKRRRRGHRQWLGMSGSKSTLGTEDVRKRLSFASNGQKTSIAADERGIPSDKVSVGDLDTAIAGELKPSIRIEDLPGRKPTTTTEPSLRKEGLPGRKSATTVERGPEPSMRMDSLPGRGPTATTGVETAKPRPLPKAIAPHGPGPTIYTTPRTKYLQI